MLTEYYRVFCFFQKCCSQNVVFFFIHLNQVENFENSFMVCTDCGVEIEQIYCNPPLSSCDEKWINEQSFFKSYNDKQFDFIDNCIRRDQIPDSCTYKIYDHYLKIKTEHDQKTNLNEVAAVAIYDWKKKIFLQVFQLMTSVHSLILTKNSYSNVKKRGRAMECLLIASNPSLLLLLLKN